MELVAVVFSLYKLGRALLGDDGKELESVVAKLAEAFLSQLLVKQSATDAALSRIEAGLGRLEAKPFQANLTIGWGYLRDAAVPDRPRSDQEHLLWQALAGFRAAAAHAMNLEQQVQALVLVACCGVARGNRGDALRALTDARDAAFVEMIKATHEYGQPAGTFELFERQRSRASRLTEAFSGGGTPYDDPGMVAARAELRREARSARDEAAALHNELQSVRAVYGANPPDCAPIEGFYEPGHQTLSPVEQGTALGGSTWRTNSPVLVWADRTPIELRGVTVTAALQTSRLIGGSTLPLFVQLAVALSAQMPVGLTVSAGWPWDAAAKGAAVRLEGGPQPTADADRSLSLPVVSADVTVNATCPVVGTPARFVIQQRGVVTAGIRHFLLATFTVSPTLGLRTNRLA